MCIRDSVYTEMRAFEDFSRINVDSVAIVPRKVRLKALQKMEEAKDSLVKYNYLAMTLKTYLITSQMCIRDSLRNSIPLQYKGCLQLYRSPMNALNSHNQFAQF